MRLWRGTIGLLVFASFFACLGAEARAGTEVASFTSPACPADVPVWHIGYRLFWSSTTGQTTDPSVLPGVLESAATFAADVSQDSACGVRATVDVFDEGSAQWPTSQESTTLPADDASFHETGHYDWVFYRFPSNGEAYCANTDAGTPAAGTRPDASRFPVGPGGSLNCGGEDTQVEPWPVLMEHEWLHAVVAFYNPRLGWPTPDVHGACAHGYECSEVSEAYFADLMQGKVAENGVPKGIQPDEWSLQGTPANPLIHTPEFAVGVKDLSVKVEFPTDLEGSARVKITDGSGATALDTTTTRSGSEFALPGPGRWTACLSFAGSERYYANESCVEARITTATITALAKRHLRTRVNRRGKLYRVVAGGLPPGSTALLSVTHAGRTHRLRGRRNGAREVFSVAAHGRGTWKLQLQVRLAGGQIVKDRPHAVRGLQEAPRKGRQAVRASL